MSGAFLLDVVFKETGKLDRAENLLTSDPAQTILSTSIYQ
jgi:hypothetical protein